MSPLVVIFVTVFIDLLGFGIIIPLLPFYAESYGASALTIGLLGTSFSLMQFLFSPIWGRWSDKIGRKPIILLGLMGSCLSYLALALATSLPLIFVARIIGGIAGANIPTAQAYIADVTTPENRAKGMGMVGAAFGLGGAARLASNFNDMNLSPVFLLALIHAEMFMSTLSITHDPR